MGIIKGPSFVKNLNIYNFTSDVGLKIRRIINPPIRKIIAKYGIDKTVILERYPDLDKDTPYIFVSTHSFVDDIMSTISQLDRNAYILIGTTEQVDNNPLMYAGWLNGMIYVNRADKQNRHDAVDKMERVLNAGTSVLIFPEGGYNHSENSTCQKIFASPYYLALRTGCKVVPIASFNEFGSKDVYISFGNPIELQEGENKRDFLRRVRNEMGAMQFEHILNHSNPINRADLGDEPRFDYLDQRIQEYHNVQWSGSHILDEELVEYNDPEEPNPRDIRDSLRQVRITKDNAYIMAPILVRMAEDDKYDRKTYMKANWDRWSRKKK